MNPSISGMPGSQMPPWAPAIGPAALPSGVSPTTVMVACTGGEKVRVPLVLLDVDGMSSIWWRGVEVLTRATRAFVASVGSHSEE